MNDVTSTKEWFLTDAASALGLLRTSQEHGLSAIDVTERRQEYGRNILAIRTGKGPLLRFLLQFHQPLIYMLLLAAAITAWLKEPVDALSWGAALAVGLVIYSIVGFEKWVRFGRTQFKASSSKVLKS